MLDVDQSVVARDADGVFQLRLHYGDGVSGALEVSPSLHPDRPSTTRVPVRDELKIAALASDRRHYFHVLGDGFHDVVAERHIPLQGTPNFRDFGGYRTEDGRRVRWGRLYRSGQLAELDGTDSEQLAALEIALVCDFRRDEERTREPSRFHAEALPRIEGLPISPGSAIDFFAALEEGRATSEQMVAFMEDINRDFALGQVSAYRRMFELLLDVDGPVLVHCAAGKDRTGFAAALILRTLGVPREQVLKDYLLTSHYLSAEREAVRIQRKYGFEGRVDVFLPMLQARDSYLRAAFSAIDEAFGDDERYLAECLSITRSERDALRARLLLPGGRG